MKVVYRKGWVRIQQMYENLELDLDLKLLFMVTGAYYESGLSHCLLKYLVKLLNVLPTVSLSFRFSFDLVRNVYIII